MENGAGEAVLYLPDEGYIDGTNLADAGIEKQIIELVKLAKEEPSEYDPEQPIEATSTDLPCCPQCGSGDVRWCDISVRPYCKDCGHWGAVNHGTKEDAVAAWEREAKP